MTVASVATKHCKKAMKMGLSLFNRGFNSSKCKTMAKMAVARMKLLRNKREVVVRQMRRDIAMLLESRQDATARIRVEHVIREQNIMAANEFLELFCELIVARLPIIAKQRECPADLKEGISSLIFAGPRCSDIPELLGLRDVFEKKYGKDFVSAATDLRPNAGVNRALIEKLSVRTPAGEVKLKVLKEIAKEYQVEWDTTESETELLKPPEELIDGPSTFVSASTLPVKSNPKQSVDPSKPISRCSENVESNQMHYNDPASAAEAAAESAKRAIAAAEVAAYLANKDTQACSFNSMGNSTAVNGTHVVYGHPSRKSFPKGSARDVENMGDGEESLPTNVVTRKINRRHSYNIPPARSDIKFDDSYYDEEMKMEEPPSHYGRPHNKSSDFDDSDYDEEMEMEKPPSHKGRPHNIVDAREVNRRHSYNVSSANHNIKFDESDYEDETEMEDTIRGTYQPPPNRPAPQVPPTYVKQNSVPRVHPKLPDYDVLAARFEALKYHKP